MAYTLRGVIGSVATATFAVFSGLTMAAVASFTPSGTSTVTQGTNLYWNLQTNATSTSPIGDTCGFYLSDHGDFHWDATNGDMVVLSNDEGGDALAAGAIIGPASRWDSANSDNEYAGTTAYSGEMVAPQTAYFGLSCMIGGQRHYGWVQITEGAADQSVLAWAYETSPNTPIAAGSTISVATVTSIPTLSEWGILLLSGLLALGAVITFRRRDLRP
ncbi:MAG: IPTL-CTERM sorting domain-containing protein [Rhodocyclaceae bacterium]|nr:IPTL-CTERM sorting domain-containing protein [Rhodocyclaceae bacterium]MBK9312580.1 IPTL-CTERM sorting domain-containing protein [Rhodocyclaceae bacterium]MBK9955767.1 IPTL-CTERM sorting domain-containing protein [Rhodocyclaceae bacterium]